MSNKQFLARYGDDGHVNSLLDTDLNGSDYVSIMKNPTTSSKNIHKLLDQKFPLRSEHMDHRNFDESHVDRLLKQGSKYTVLNLIDSNKLQSHHIDRTIDFNDRDIHHELSINPNLTGQQIDRILSHPNLMHGTVRELLHHKNTSKEALDKIITHGHPDHATDALLNPKLNLDDLKHYAENHPNAHVKNIANAYHAMFSDHMLTNESVNSDEFKSWFGKSVLHTDGKPTTFYHGTSSDVTSFKSGGGNQWGHGHYFIKSPKIASQYATDETTGVHSRIAPKGNAAPNVMPVHLRMENPFVMDAPLTKETHKKIEKHLGESLKDYYWQGMKNRDLHQVLHQSFLNSVDDANGVLKRAGYDGIREASDDSIHMVFDPHQIKSAIGNRGKYSKTSSDITESFDSQLTKTGIPKDSMLHAMGSMSAAMIGGDKFQMHKLDKAGYMIQFDKDGATELHHVDDDLQGGYLRSKQPSMRMISTYRGVIKDLLDKGSKVRLVAHDALADKFAAITTRMVNKNPEYKMSEPVETQHEITGDKLKSWELSK